MTRAARYTVLIDRELGESDGSGVYHDGTGQTAVVQLAKELQELWDAAGGTGFFEVVQRQIVTWPATGELFRHEPRHYEDETPTAPTRADYAGRLRFLGALLADIKDEFSTGEVAISLDNALDDVDSAIRTLEGDGPDDLFCHECGQEFGIDEAGIANHVDPSSPTGIDHDADEDHVPYALDDE